jgi:hypothetical protein
MMLVRIDDKEREKQAQEDFEEAARKLAEINTKRPLTKEQAEDLTRRST